MRLCYIFEIVTNFTNMLGRQHFSKGEKSQYLSFLHHDYYNKGDGVRIRLKEKLIQDGQSQD